MALTVLFWILLGLTGFAFTLAVQMRIMIGVVVARALRARDSALGIRQSRLAVVLAGNDEPGDEPVQHILTTYPAQVRQLRLARRITQITPALLIILIVSGRALGRI